MTSKIIADYLQNIQSVTQTGLHNKFVES